jgi:hypothetical protein
MDNPVRFRGQFEAFVEVARDLSAVQPVSPGDASASIVARLWVTPNMIKYVR